MRPRWFLEENAAGRPAAALSELRGEVPACSREMKVAFSELMPI